MAGLRGTAVLVLMSSLFLPAAWSKEVVVDLSSLAPADAKTAPPAPKEPKTQSVEMNPNDILVVRSPSKQYPGDRGWVEYHAGLIGTGCLISAFGKQEPHSEFFQATRLGTQNVVVGVKQPGKSVIEKDCVLSVKVVPAQQGVSKATMTNVQTFSGSSFNNKTSATTGSGNIINGVSKGGQAANSSATSAKTASHSVDELSKSTVKTYDSSK